MHRIIGTAGHIDHGKTELVRALTGIDTDRLRQEKERGISIELGFAFLELPAGERAGIVDVPGHERFIRNMLAGAHGLDLVLLVVAADDGVMPQTEEHLDIVHLLGVSEGIVVVTKTDLVDRARIDEVREEIDILTTGTALERAPVVPVSAVTGEGVETLRGEIVRRLGEGSGRARRGRFRLPVDRSFVLRGHGLVVTGTAVSGDVGPGDTVRILPAGHEVRVRTVQVHGTETPRAGRGQRIALNVVGADRDQIRRGDVVVHPSLHATTERIDAHVEIRPMAKRPIPNRRRVRLYVGTTEVFARLVYLGGRTEMAPGDTGYAQLVCERPVVTFRGDRIILRSESADRTIGGGTVVHPFAARHRASDPRVPRVLESVGSEDPATAVLAILELDRAFARTPAWLAQGLDVPDERIRELPKHSAIEALPDADRTELLTTRTRWQEWRNELVETIRSHHEAHPLLPGAEMEPLRSHLAPDTPAKTFRAILKRLEAEGRLVRDGNRVRLPDHRVRLDAEEERATGTITEVLERAGRTPPDPKEIAREANVAPARAMELLHALDRSGRVVRVTQGLFFTPAVLDDIKEEVIRHLRGRGEMTAAEFRDLIGVTRKFAIPLLEYFDRTGFTIRVGDVRRLRRS